MIKKLNVIIFTALLSLSMLSGGDIYARGGSSGGGHSSSSSHSSFSSGRSSSGGSKSWGSGGSSGSSKSWGTGSSSSNSTSKNWGTNSSSSTGGFFSKSSSDSALSSKVNQSGGTSSRAALVSKFEANKANQAKYTSTFTSQPSQRPNYIPTYYTDPYNNTYHYVYYNPSYMGYGYYNMWGNWVFYNSLHNMAVTNAAAPHWGWTVFFIILIFAAIGAFIIIIPRLI